MVIALVFAVLCGFVALAVDIGHVVMVKAELQRTADAGALAGVAGLAPYTGNPPAPYWFGGQTAAKNIVNDINNKADNQQFSIAISDVIAGYWKLNPQGQSQTLPQSRPSTTYIPEPAIQVTLTRSVTLRFAPVIGINNVQNVTATATAILPEANSIDTGVFAMAVEKTIVEDPSTHKIILTPQDFGWHDHGQWYTTVDAQHQPPADGNNDVPTIRKNIPIQDGAQIWIAPGSMNTLYPLITPYQTIIVPVVDSTNQKKWQTICGFAAFYITAVVQNSIEGHFVGKYFSPSGVPGAGDPANYGVWGTPKLVGP